LAGALYPAQGFQNLGFELADTSSVGSSAPGVFWIYASNAIPYWTAGQGDGVVEARPLYNSFRATTAGQVGLYDGTSWLPAPLHGHYSVFLAAGHGDPFGGEGSGDSFFSQTGHVPGLARSIHFTTSNGGLDPSWDDPYELRLSLDEQVIPYVEIDSTAFSRTFAADVTSFASGYVELEFLLHNLNPAADAGMVIGLDNIWFSSEPIPEPSTPALLGVSMVALMLLRTKGEPGAGAKRQSAGQ
jgi:hypothetical protein